MSVQKIIFWIFLLVVLDQIIKIIINSFFLEIRFEIIPPLFEFKPFFNDKHSYLNSLLYRYFNINLGWLFHGVVFLFSMIMLPSIWVSFRKIIPKNKKLLDLAFMFGTAGLICALIGNLIWEKGTLDYIYLKPLFIFDLKDLYINCFVILFLIYMHKNKAQIKALKTKNIILCLKEQLKIA